LTGTGVTMDEDGNAVFISDNYLNTLILPTIHSKKIKNIGRIMRSDNRKYVAYQTYDLMTNDNSLVMLDFKTKKQIGKSIKPEFVNETIRTISEDGKYILTYKVSGKNTLYKVYNVLEGKEVYRVASSTFHLIQFLEGDWVFEFHAIDKTITKRNLATNEVIPFSFDLLSDKIKNSKYNFSMANSKLLFFNTSDADHNKLNAIWNIQTGKLLYRFEGILSASGEPYPTPSMNGKFSDDNLSLILPAPGTGGLNIYNLSTLAKVKSFSGHKGMIIMLDISPDGKQIISGTINGETKLWNAESGKEIGSLVRSKKKGFAFVAPDHYYFATKGAKDYVHFSYGKNIYLFDQFDLKYNRPDILLERYNSTDQSLIQAYHKAYLKRIKRMGFTEEMLSSEFKVPEIVILNENSFESKTDSSSLVLKIEGKDKRYKLDRLNVWVNDVAIYGKKGLSLKSLDSKSILKDVAIQLAKGHNKIQVSVLNQGGIESFKKHIEIDCTHGKEKPDLYLITIGESKFQQSAYNLKYASKDANDIVKIFKTNKTYANVISKTIVNDQVTKSGIEDLKSMLSKAGINDHVILFIAGHGVLDENLDYYFASYDMDFQNPAEKGIPYENLENLLDGISPLKKILLIDACHSGEIDKDEVELAKFDAKESGDIKFRAVGNTVTPKLGMQNSGELSKSLFEDLKRGTGATVISSAGGMEFAMEGASWSNGLFTYCLINGLKSKKADLDKNGEIWLSEIKEYVQDEVLKLSGGRQRPTSRIENIEMDFRIW
jgi:WD40 repeat protein